MDKNKPFDDAEAYLKIGDGTLSRRGFAALTAVAAPALMSAAAAHAQTANVVETDVVIATTDGAADAALFHPAGQGPWPGVVMYADALGLRPAFRDMGRRLAASGYTVLVPNPYYRARKAPVITGPFDFTNPDARAKLDAMRKGMSPEGTQRDQLAWVAYLDTLPVVSKTTKLGVVGYCMGGPAVMQTSALRPDRVGASCSFHGGGVVTDQPDSPHLLAPKIKAKSYFGIAANDAMRQPDQKDKLIAAYAAAGNPAEVEVYSANHGWCVKDGAVYNEAEAERAWGHLLAVYKAALV
jgi:carboxymethylenebutenolidase